MWRENQFICAYRQAMQKIGANTVINTTLAASESILCRIIGTTKITHRIIASSIVIKDITTIITAEMTVMRIKDMIAETTIVSIKMESVQNTKASVKKQKNGLQKCKPFFSLSRIQARKCLVETGRFRAWNTHSIEHLTLFSMICRFPRASTIGASKV